MTASARRRPDHVAVKLDDAEVTYGLLDEGSARVAGLLRDRGIGPGDRVGVMLPNVPYFPVVYYGIVRAGAVVVPMNVLLKGREVAYYLEDSGAKLLFAWHGFAEEAATGAEKAGDIPVVSVEPQEFEGLLAETEPVRELAEVDGGDTAVILYTSGTTGQPKGAELTHDNLSRNADDLRRTAIEIGDDDILFGGLPLFHTFGQTCCMNAAAVAGATLTLLARFDPAKALEIIQRDQVTDFAGVPTMHAALLHHAGREDYDTSSLRRCISGGASLPGEVLRGVEEAFGVVILEGYGLSRDIAGRLVQPALTGAPGRLDRPPGRGRRDEGRRRRRQRGRDRRGRRDRHPGPQHHEGLPRPPGRHRRRRSATAGSTPATSARSTRTASSSSSTARRT